MATILIVDDDDDIRQSLHVLFAGEGYRVAVAAGGAQALQMLRGRTERTLVVFDYLMPRGDGLDLLRGVAQDAAVLRRSAYICIAARTRARLPDEFTALLDTLAVPFVAKPFDVDDLLSTVDGALRRLSAPDVTGRDGQGVSGHQGD